MLEKILEALLNLTTEVTALRAAMGKAVPADSPTPAIEKPKATATKPAAEKPKAAPAAPKAKSFVEIHQQATKFVAKNAALNTKVIKAINADLGIANLTAIKEDAEQLAAYAKKLDAADAAYEASLGAEEGSDL